jgi:hypothetical protein
MIEILANYFRSVFLLSPDDLLCSVYLCLNQLAPAYMGKSRIKSKIIFYTTIYILINDLQA